MTSYSYNNWLAMSDKALLEHIGTFIKHHRIEKAMSQFQLAKEASISRSTLSQLEKGEAVNLLTLIQVLRVLDQLPVMDAFTIEQTISPLAMAVAEQQIRYRVRPKKNKPNPSSPPTDW